jgi:Zn-finger nucleic acid-binding protein
MSQRMRGEMKCPRCHTKMMTVKRSGINVDECTGCGGVFLDRGELEQLMAAEDGHYAEQFGAFYPEPEGRHRRVQGKRGGGGFIRAILGGKR